MKSVLGELRITLYDIFGYLVPGLVALTGLVIFFWAVFASKAEPDGDLKGVVWTAVLLVAYLVGHVLQALANHLPRFAFHIEQEWRDDPVAGRFDEAIERALEAKHLKPEARRLPSHATEKERARAIAAAAEAEYRICDEVLVQYGVTSERELYTYREGFYRAMTVALVILAIGLLVRLRGDTTFVLDKPHQVTGGMLLFFALIVVASAYACYGRYRRFARYRAWTALLGAPVIIAKLKGS